MVTVCMLVCKGCQWLGPNSGIPGALAVGNASYGGARPGGGGWRALPAPGDRKNIRRRPGRAALQRRRAGARGEEVSAFRPPGRQPSGESPPTPAARRIGGRGHSGEIWVAGAPEVGWAEGRDSGGSPKSRRENQGGRGPAGSRSCFHPQCEIPNKTPNTEPVIE